MSNAENRLFGVSFGSNNSSWFFPRDFQPGLGLVGSEAGAAGAVAGVAEAFPPKILNMTVPHVGHLPLMALRPFFMVSSTASTISFLALHLTQYP
jgi:hypothetical protein